MRPLLRRLLCLGIAFLAIYSVGMILSFVISPPRDAIVDTFGEKFNVFGRNAGLVVRGQQAFSQQSRQVFIVGASNVQVGFRPDLIMPQLTGYRVHNLSVGASNITQARQVVDLVLETVPMNSYHDTVFIIGIIYPHFVTDEQRWKGGHTSIEDEMLRYGLYRRKEGTELEATAGSIGTPKLLWLLRPYLAIDAIVHHGVVMPVIETAVYAYNRWGRKTPVLNVTDLDSVVVDESYKQYRMRFWDQYMGTRNGHIEDEQFKVLEVLAAKIEAVGSRLLILELPIPQWHRERAAHYPTYLRKKQGLRTQLAANKHVSFVNMEDLDDNNAFHDSVHPKPRTRKLWSQLLADRLAKLLGIVEG